MNCLGLMVTMVIQERTDKTRCRETAVLNGELCECMREKGHEGAHIDYTALAFWGPLRPEDSARILEAVAGTIMSDCAGESGAGAGLRMEGVVEEGEKAILGLLGSGIPRSSVRFTGRSHGRHVDVVARIAKHSDAVVYCPAKRAVMGEAVMDA